MRLVNVLRARAGRVVARPAMRRGAARLSLAVAALCTAAVLHLAAAPANFLWKATGPRGGTVFIAGSLHLLTDEYYPLAPAFDEAFAQGPAIEAAQDRQPPVGRGGFRLRVARREVGVDVRLVRAFERTALPAQPLLEQRKVAPVRIERVPRQSLLEPEGVDEGIDRGGGLGFGRCHASLTGK